MINLENKNKALVVIFSTEKSKFTEKDLRSILSEKADHGFKPVEIFAGPDFIVKFVRSIEGVD